LDWTFAFSCQKLLSAPSLSEPAPLQLKESHSASRYLHHTTTVATTTVASSPFQKKIRRTLKLEEDKKKKKKIKIRKKKKKKKKTLSCRKVFLEHIKCILENLF